MYGAGPAYDCGDAQAIQTRVTMVALFNINPKDGMAVVMRRSRVELARAAIGAVAVNELSAAYCPILGRK